jgi:hypothetical protein
MMARHSKTRNQSKRMLANTLHNKSQKKKRKKRKEKLKTAHTIPLPNPGKLIYIQ